MDFEKTPITTTKILYWTWAFTSYILDNGVVFLKKSFVIEKSPASLIRD